MRCFAFLLLLLSVSGCKSEYQQLLDKEMASGVKHDSLFLGYYFGMPSDSFFNYSRTLNEKGVISDYNGTRVLLKLDTALQEPINMVFYPKFDTSGDIAVMPVEFEFNNWTNYTPALGAKFLMPKVLVYLKNLFTTSFITLKDDKNRVVHVSIQGNRRIRVFEISDRFIRAEIMDLSRSSLKK